MNFSLYLLTQRSSQSFVSAMVIATTIMVGCASKPQVPARRLILPVPESYVVKRGDTLSSIAARYDLDYRELGRINNLDANYTIYADQRLRFKDRGLRVDVRPPVHTSVTVPIKTQPLAVATSTPPTTVTVVTPVASSTIAASTTNSTVVTQGWQWPTQNQILLEFNPPQQVKGIRFGGKIGDSVRAVADGEVVYANNGLREYGNLVLIRHLNGYISAYAHNSRLLVREGERVRLGQTIAEMGDSGTTQVMLELQIRSNGKPINPRGVLPTR
jgi:lipoprotein NlpD